MNFHKHLIKNRISLYNPYPNVGQAWFALLIVAICQIISAVWLLLFEEEGALVTFLIYSTGMGLSLLTLVVLRRAQEEPGCPLFQTDKVPLPVYALIILSIPAMMMVSGPIANLLPVPDYYIEKLQEVVGRADLMTFLTLAIAAPIFEELIFRGIILDGMLRHTTSTKAIAYSAIIFSIAHMNPVQVPQTLLLGAFIGWIYYRTRSVWPCIFIHFINNGSVFLLTMSSDVESMSEASVPDISYWTYLIILATGLIILSGIVKMISSHIPHVPAWKIRSEEE